MASGPDRAGGPSGADPRTESAAESRPAADASGSSPLIRRLYATIAVLALAVVGLAIGLALALADDDGPAAVTVDGTPVPVAVEPDEFVIVVERCDDTGANGTIESRIDAEAQVGLAVDFLDGDRRLFSGRLRLRLEPEAVAPWTVPYDAEVVGERAAGVVPACDVYVQNANLAG